VALDKHPFACSNKSPPLTFLAIATPPHGYAAIIA